MFSNFSNIIGHKPRQAETTDTRLGIKRHDPDQQPRKKKKRSDKNPIGFDEDDSAMVSIEALRLFLQNFLKSNETDTPEQKTESQNAETATEQKASMSTAADQPQTSDSPRDGQAAQAASAYQHSAETSPKSTFSAADGSDTETIAQSLGLGSDEIRTIHSLLDDLKILSDRKVEYLRIERSDSFLHSLVNAVAKIKH